MPSLAKLPFCTGGFSFFFSPSGGEFEGNESSVYDAGILYNGVLSYDLITDDNTRLFIAFPVEPLLV